MMVQFYRSAVLAALGQTDTALEELEGLLDKGFRDFVTLEASPYFAELRVDPRYQALIDRFKS